MRDLDETDLEILDLLLSDARQPWSEIAEVVDLSPPAVSERVKRLQEIGIIRRFTVDVDRSQLYEGVPILLKLTVKSERFESVRAELLEAEAVEYVFTTAEHDLLCYALVVDGDVPTWLAEILDVRSIKDYDVQLLTGVKWTPTLRETKFALTCAECGNTVTREGTAARIGDELHQFCCSSCEARFEEQYERMEEEATG
ncbi:MULTISPECIES: winged helix-turn-helix transcriptional regulator [Halococcaceae]|uniref:Transcription regulator n=1 Tax=Halalkalicoccus jeotgali (strain DSM 18796 / CECT 7217 / JCM 14584 / KCTC 4019 / B3) TaxID=795797 RepID=D8JAZ0_HALJB|nr:MULTISPECIES: winged helix-turn-helix transcriptional regulator [Halococcaceae]ADJ16443.1 transcription regulator [Halalkalicoccus jeotgali B3]ADJ17167.1 transcription regulator [Halalkalicoccus jeotgali B3]